MELEYVVIVMNCLWNENDDRRFQEILHEVTSIMVECMLRTLMGVKSNKI